MATPEGTRGSHDFATTRWSVVRDAAQGNPESRAALELLVRAYWHPLYALARRLGGTAEQAEDQVQDFFAALLEGDLLARADPERGRFRSWLLGAFKHHVGHLVAREKAQKRGGARQIVRLDLAGAEDLVVSDAKETPEEAFERVWALTVLEQARCRLRHEQTALGASDRFEQLAPHFGFPGERAPHAEIAGRLGISEVALKVALYRLRQRFRELLRAEVAETLGPNDDVDQEIQALLRALSEH